MANISFNIAFKELKIAQNAGVNQLFELLSSYTAISRKVVGKMCTRQTRKVIWDMINALFLTTVPVEPTFVAFL